MVKKKHHMLIFGLDGSTFDLIKPWIKSGKLKNLKKVYNDGIKGVLKSTIPPLTSPACPCLYTGKNPAKLDVFNFMKLGKLVTSNDVKSRKLWDYLSEYDVKTAIINVPITYPPEKVNGLMISGRNIPNDRVEGVYPPEKQDEIKKQFPIGEEWGKEVTQGTVNSGKFLEMQTKFSKKRINFLGKILDNYEFIFFWILGTDKLQHHYWNRKKLLLKFYKEIDKELGKILKKFNGDLIILSDHGFEAVPKYVFHTNIWLEKNKYLKRKSGVLKAIYNKVENFLPKKIIKKFILQKVREKKKSDNIGKTIPFVNWKKTLAYKDRFGIRIIKQNCKNYEKTRDEIIEKLKKLKYKNRNVIREVYKREEVFSGEYLEKIPDIIVLESGEFESDYYLSGEIFSNVKKSEIKGRKIYGTHGTARNGIFLAYGENIKKGNIDAKIYDVVPTVLHYFGIPIPEDIDGEVLNIFNKKFKAKKVKKKTKKLNKEKDLILDLIKKRKI